MKVTMTLLGVGLLLAASLAAQTPAEIEKYSIWVGMHQTSFDEYAKKVGEYRYLLEDLLPEFRFGYFSANSNSAFSINSHYFDKEHIYGEVNTTVSDQFKGKFLYRSSTRQLGQDLLENIEAREWYPLSSTNSGKILTHELQDVGADYSYERRELLNEISLLLSRQNNVRLVASHRSIFRDGKMQTISSNHCFSCHLTSQSTPVKDQMHSLQAGIEAEIGKYDVGYTFGYRVYNSEAATPTAYYDEAKHPVNGGSGAEFSSRQVFDDTTITYSQKPHTEKMSHKVKFGGDIAKGRFAGALGYSRAENTVSQLVAHTYSGVGNYARVLSPRTRLVAKGTLMRSDAGDPFIEVPVYRRGRPGVQTDFSYTRWSTLDRIAGTFDAEVTHRINERWTLAVLGGIERVSRDDYPSYDAGTTSNTLIGQAKLRYRKGLRYTSTLKYRFEKTSDPFVSGRGLFERPGSELDPVSIGGTQSGYFYYQREDLRYQDITTEPTDYHEIKWDGTYRPTAKVSANLGFRYVYDKNGDLDTLDVKHTVMQPSLALTLTPDVRWSLTGGFTYNYNKSRGPVAVALFDG